MTPEAEVKIPGPDTFSLADYIEGKSTFPSFTHTVYLDQESGTKLVQLADEYDDLVEEGRKIERALRARSESGATSLVDDTAEELSEKLAKIEERVNALEPQIEELDQRVKASGVTLLFRVGTPEKLAAVTNQAEKSFRELHDGSLDENDAEMLTLRTRHILVSYAAAYCTGLTLGDGREFPAPDRAGYAKLMESLDGSQSLRLLNQLTRALDSSKSWADRIDAGFPGRGSDLGGKSLGGDRSEDGA